MDAYVCGDYKVTINPVLDVDQYPLPKPDDILATLFGGQRFTTLDLSHAYNQLILDEESRKYVTINTHKSLPIYSTPIWDRISTRGVPENDGHHSPRC